MEWKPRSWRRKNSSRRARSRCECGCKHTTPQLPKPAACWKKPRPPSRNSTPGGVSWKRESGFPVVVLLNS